MNRMLNKHRSEEGLVSIIIVTTIIIILSLTTVGFARIMDRELRQALDRELSAQAQYAAEAGLNGARAYIDALNNEGREINSTGANCLDITDDGTPNPTINYFVKSISGSYSTPNDSPPTDNLVKYTCVLLNTTPKDLIYEIPAGESRVFKMALPGQTLDRLYFSWRNSDYCSGTNCTPQALGTVPNLPQESSVARQTHGLLRTTIYPIRPGAATNATLTSDSRHYFLYPNAGSGAGIIDAANYASQNGTFVNGNCNLGNEPTTPGLPYGQGTGRYCNSQVDFCPGACAAQATYGLYYVRLTAVYQKLKVSVQAQDPLGNPLTIFGSQVIVDVTGEGNDVLRRIQARVPYLAEMDLPNNGLQSIEELCKRLRLPAIGPNTFGPAEQDDSVAGDAACQPG